MAFLHRVANGDGSSFPGIGAPSHPCVYFIMNLPPRYAIEVEEGGDMTPTQQGQDGILRQALELPDEKRRA
jgi:hypothetical protein